MLTFAYAPEHTRPMQFFCFGRPTKKVVWLVRAFAQESNIILMLVRTMLLTLPVEMERPSKLRTTISFWNTRLRRQLLTPCPLTTIGFGARWLQRLATLSRKWTYFKSLSTCRNAQPHSPSESGRLRRRPLSGLQRPLRIIESIPIEPRWTYKYHVPTPRGCRSFRRIAVRKG
jgi:hypothetical protein